MHIDAFRNLDRSEVASLIRAAGPKVCVFPLNGTRRWFLLEKANGGQSVDHNYYDAITRRLIVLCELMFEHGISVLLMPLLSPHLFKNRHEAYTKEASASLAWLGQPRFLDFYQEHDVRVRFYGEYRTHFAGTAFEHLTEQFDALTRQTSHHTSHLLLWGICAHDAAETTAALAVQYYREHGRTPDKEALISLYYGEPIPPVDIFISSSKPRAFDMPLITSGREDLYFTVAPSPYLGESQLRNILFDHLYARPNAYKDYSAMRPEEWQTLQRFYQVNIDRTLGVGARHTDWGVWHPIPQVRLEEKQK